jgi:D-aminoacyl-tRNA deacylase
MPVAHMRAVIQRVIAASVTVDGQPVGQIGRGLLVLVGVSTTDTAASADYLIEKVLGLRIFEDHEGKMNLSVRETGGALLVVSQFTLFGDVRRGKRPSFDDAARPEQAKALYQYLVSKIRQQGIECSTGEFQAMMQVWLINDGPVTILIDSEKVF